MTENGKKIAKAYIRELEAKRKELLDAGKDTAAETSIPTVEDILSDIEYVGISWDDPNGPCYYNGWAVTDNYDADQPLDLKLGRDFIMKDNVGEGRGFPDGMDAVIYNTSIHMEDIVDSMQLDSGTFIAALMKKGTAAFLEVCGDVRVIWTPDGGEGEIYTKPSAFPAELARLVADGLVDSDERAAVINNNWFEVFIRHNGEYDPDGIVVDAEGLDRDELQKLLEDCLDEYTSEKGEKG